MLSTHDITRALSLTKVDRADFCVALAYVLPVLRSIRDEIPAWQFLRQRDMDELCSMLEDYEKRFCF
jgi:hypothetical protein